MHYKVSPTVQQFFVLSLYLSPHEKGNREKRKAVQKLTLFKSSKEIIEFLRIYFKGQGLTELLSQKRLSYFSTKHYFLLNLYHIGYYYAINVLYN